MGRYDYYRSGDWNTECDVCGQKYKASKLRLRWDGLRVCPKDFEFRNPQDFVRGVQDNQSVPFSRPEPPDVFSVFNYTQYPSDPVPLFEAVSKAFTKQINFKDAISTSTLGGSALGILSLGGSPQSFPLSADDVPLSDSASISLAKPISDSFTFSEIVSLTLTTTTSLGSSALGTHALGA